MKSSSLIITVLFSGCGLAMAQEPTKGRIYIGSVKDAPAWVWQFTKVFSDAKHVAANGARLQWVESLRAQQRRDAQEAMLKPEAAGTEYAADPRNRILKPESGGPQLMRQRGILLDFSPTTLAGLISGEDGKRWPFQAIDWADPTNDPKPGLLVDFAPETETGCAVLVYSLGPLTAKQLELLCPR